MLWVILVQAIVGFTTIEHDQNSNIDASREVVVRTAEEWQRLWNEHALTRPLPGVDFDASTVVGVFLSSRPRAGFEIEILTIREEEDLLVVKYQERRPPPGAVAAQIITSPFHLVRIARHDGETAFEKVTTPQR